jgi:hypothetical protein
MSGSSSSGHAPPNGRRRRLLLAVAALIGGVATHGAARGQGAGRVTAPEGDATGAHTDPVSAMGGDAAGAAAAAAAGDGASTAPTCTARAPLPPRFKLEYVAKASRGALSLEGENELVFATTGTRYTLRSATRSVLFSAEQDSAGERVGALLQPHEYHERSPRRPLRTTRIDWQADRVTFSANVDGGTATQPRMQDRLSLLLSAGQQLRLQKGTGAVEFPVAGARHVSLYRFELRGLEALELPIGRLEAHRLERPRDAEHDGIEVWVAPALCWLPVKMRFVDDRGQVVQNQLRAARFD